MILKAQIQKSMMNKFSNHSKHFSKFKQISFELKKNKFSKVSSSLNRLKIQNAKFSSSSTPITSTQVPKRKYDGPLFVFLEGGAATGKSSLCQELLNRNYTVQFENFVKLCSEVIKKHETICCI